MKGATSAMMLLLLVGGVIVYLLMDKIGYTPPTSLWEETLAEDAEAEEPAIISPDPASASRPTPEIAPLPPADPGPVEPAANPQQPAPSELQGWLETDRAALDAEKQALEQERLRLAVWDADLQRRSDWIWQAEQSALALQADLVEKLGHLNESIAQADSRSEAAQAQALASQHEREQLRQEKERLEWLQLATLLLADLILGIGIAGRRRSLGLWLRALQERSGGPNRAAGKSAARFLRPT